MISRSASILIVVAVLGRLTALPAADIPNKRDAPSITRTASTNLFRLIMQNKDRLSWESHGDAFPKTACKLLFADCPNGSLFFKILGYPLATPDAQDEWAVVLGWSNNEDRPDFVILASATEKEAIFFVLAPDGSLLKAARRSRGGVWTTPILSSDYEHFERERNAWCDWLLKTTSH